MLADSDIADLTALARRLADAAAGESLAHFRRPDLAADNKLDEAGFDPVTAADRGAEAAIRAILRRERPADGIFGEEEERITGTSGLTWVIDPIDGTRAFISGLPTWGTLIALDDGTRGRIGIVDQPHIGERFVGTLGTKPTAELHHGGERQAIRVRSGRRLGEATLFTTDPYIFGERETAAFQTVRARAQLTRFGIDCYAYALLAMGQIDLVIEAGLHAYDIAAPKVLIEAAGGIVTDWQGGECRWGGQVVAAATTALHEEVLEVLAAAG